MREETIERVFTRNDWNESTCDVCADHKSVVLLSDERVCYDCLLHSFDERGDKIETNTAILITLCDKCGNEMTIDHLPHPEEITLCHRCSSIDFSKEIERDYAEIQEQQAKMIAARNFAVNIVMLVCGTLIGAGAVLAGSVR